MSRKALPSFARPVPGKKPAPHPRAPMLRLNQCPAEALEERFGWAEAGEAADAATADGAGWGSARGAEAGCLAQSSMTSEMRWLSCCLAICISEVIELCAKQHESQRI